MERRTDKGYHIREFPEEARRLARAGAMLEGVSVGRWIADAVRDRWRRRNPKLKTPRNRAMKVTGKRQESEKA